MVSVLGIARLAARLQDDEGKRKREVAKALNDVAQEVYGESQRIVPVDTGNLKGSGRVEPATPENLVAIVSYGGTAAEYALPVHELHPTKSKYLEAPARAATGMLVDVVRRAIVDGMSP